MQLSAKVLASKTYELCFTVEQGLCMEDEMMLIRLYMWI